MLGGMARRCLAVLSLLATAVGIGGLIAGKTGWYWFVIGGLFVLAVGAGWTALDEHKVRMAAQRADDRPAILDREIADGEALLAIEDNPTQWHEWGVWAERVYTWLRTECGLTAAQGFSNAGRPPGVNPNHMPACIASQVAYLRELRGARASRRRRSARRSGPWS